MTIRTHTLAVMPMTSARQLRSASPLQKAARSLRLVMLMAINAIKILMVTTSANLSRLPMRTASSPTQIPARRKAVLMQM